MDDYIKGTCMQMCPEEEMKMREKENLVHVLEAVSGTENNKRPKADRNLMVKSFSRSAAGKNVNKVENLRPPEILLKTVSYLLFDVINSAKLDFHAIYDFIHDRLRAIRQDMVVQNVSTAESIAILQPIIRFYAYSSYKLCNEKQSNFDPVLNNNHLQECLKRLLSSYDSSNKLFLSNYNTNKESINCYNYLIEARPEFEALYVVFNLGNEEALRRALSLPRECKTKIVLQAVELSLCFCYGNFVRMCRIMKKLPTLLTAVASLFLPKIRRKAFIVMSTAYHSKNLKFPVTTLQEILLYGSVKELLEDTKYYGIMNENDSILFSKQNFNSTRDIVPPRKEVFVEEKFSKEDLNYILFSV